MLCVGMKPLLDPPGNGTKRNSLNPLECPPSLSNNNQFQRRGLDTRLSEGNEVIAGLATGDFLQNHTNGNGRSAFSDSNASRISFQQNNLNASNMNLREQLLSSLASQIMSQRPIVMNYSLQNSHQQSLGTRSNVGGGNVQGMTLGSNQAMVALASNKGVTNANSQASFQKASSTRVPCQARGMSTDHNALVSYYLL